MIRSCFLLGLILVSWTASAADAELRYVDGRDLPMEGRAFADTPGPYSRLPSTVTTNVNERARRVGRNSAGLQFRFRTDSDILDFRWTMAKAGLGSANMTGILRAGIDIYREKPDGTWEYAATGRPKAEGTNSCSMAWNPGTACLVYLPCYGEVVNFRLGIRPGSKIEPIAHGRATKPVVFYGTSITQGGCASRPGLAWVSLVGRELDVPVVNLGFSGAGRMELEMADHLASIDASCYVLDCIPNMLPPLIEERFQPFVRRLRAARPGVPIVVAERTVNGAEENDRNVVLKRLYEGLAAERAEGLFYVPSEGLLPSDREGTAEGGHPNDLGMVSIAKVFTRVLRKVLQK